MRCGRSGFLVRTKGVGVIRNLLPRLRVRPAVAVALLTAVAAALRVYRLSYWSLEGDEIFTLRDSLTTVWLRGPKPLLFFLNHHLIVPWTGLDELSLRILPAVFGVAAIPVMYIMVDRTMGMRAGLGLSGVTFELETLEQLLIGGLALATPPDAADMVRTGHRFELAVDPPENRLDWQPLVVIGSEMLPPGAPVPRPLRARVEYRKGRWLARDKSIQGWVLQTERGLLGPADLLRGRQEDAIRVCCSGST